MKSHGKFFYQSIFSNYQEVEFQNGPRPLPLIAAFSFYLTPLNPMKNWWTKTPNPFATQMSLKFRPSRRFMVRDFTYNEEELAAGKTELAKLATDKKKQFVSGSPCR